MGKHKGLKLTVIEAMNITMALDSIAAQLDSQKSVPAQLSYAVNKNLKQFASEFKTLQEQLQKINDKHIKKRTVKNEETGEETETPVPAKDKDGNPIPDRYEVVDQEEYNKELREFYDMEVDIDVHRIKLRYFEGVRLDRQSMAVIEKLINVDVDVDDVVDDSS